MRDRLDVILLVLGSLVLISWLLCARATAPVPADPVNHDALAIFEPPIASEPQATCCCSTRNGFCCGEQTYCSGTFVLGCACR